MDPTSSGCPSECGIEKAVSLNAADLQLDTGVFLPQEIIDEIIDLVGLQPGLYSSHKRRSDLCSCSLVCKRWVYRSRKTLFHSISLDGPRRWHKLTEALRVLPHHAQDVQVFYLHDGFRIDNLTPDEFLLKLRDLLPCLDVLTLTSVDYRVDTSSPLLLRFASVRTLTLINCHLGSITKFHSFIEAFPSLVSIFLDECALEDHTPSPYPDLTRFRPNLQTIQIYYDYYWPLSFHEWLSHAPHLRIVQFTQEMAQMVSFSGGLPESIALSKSLKCIGHSLVRLQLSSYLFQAEQMYSSLAFCTSLQELSVKDVGRRLYLDNVIRGVRCLRSTDMKQFTFKVVIRGENKRPWKSLDNALHCGRFTRLERVLIKYQHGDEAKIRDCFPLSAVRGVLQMRDMTVNRG